MGGRERGLRCDDSQNHPPHHTCDVQERFIFKFCLLVACFMSQTKVFIFLDVMALFECLDFRFAQTTRASESHSCMFEFGITRDPI